MTSEAEIEKGRALIRVRLAKGPIAAKNDRDAWRQFCPKGELSIRTIMRAMSSMIRSGEVSRSRRTQPSERGMGPSEVDYRLR